jgi:hypothetical protein
MKSDSRLMLFKITFKKMVFLRIIWYLNNLNNLLLMGIVHLIFNIFKKVYKMGEYLLMLGTLDIIKSMRYIVNPTKLLRTYIRLQLVSVNHKSVKLRWSLQGYCLVLWNLRIQILGWLLVRFNSCLWVMIRGIQPFLC